MTKMLMEVPCNTCEGAPATRLAQYHPGLLVCKDCKEEEPRPGEHRQEEEPRSMLRKSKPM